MSQVNEENLFESTVCYTRGNDLSGSMERAGGIGGLLARSSGYSDGNWTTHNYYFADGNVNVTCSGIVGMGAAVCIVGCQSCSNP